MKNAKTLLFWSDEEVGLLLRVSLDYKRNKSQDGLNWETCRAKYEEITRLFKEQYPRGSNVKEFPHKDIIAKGQVTSKLKNVKRNYRRAVDVGRRNGNGRVVLLYFELCEQLWGHAPATRSIDDGVETNDLPGSPDREDSPPASEEIKSEAGPSDIPPPVVTQSGDLLQAKMNSHRGDSLKRKVSGEPEDQEMKRWMLASMEESRRDSKDNLDRMNDNMAEITSTIKDGFALMRELYLQPSSNFARPQSSSAGCQSHGHPTPLTPTTPQSRTPQSRTPQSRTPQSRTPAVRHTQRPPCLCDTSLSESPEEEEDQDSPGPLRSNPVPDSGSSQTQDWTEAPRKRTQTLPTFNCPLTGMAAKAEALNRWSRLQEGVEEKAGTFSEDIFKILDLNNSGSLFKSNVEEEMRSKPRRGSDHGVITVLEDGKAKGQSDSVQTPVQSPTQPNGGEKPSVPHQDDGRREAKAEGPELVDCLHKENKELKATVAELRSELEAERRHVAALEICLKNAERSRDEAQRRNRELQKDIQQFLSVKPPP